MRSSKSRCGKLIPGAVLVALVAATAVSPGAVLAAPANNEYSLDLPTGDGGGQDPTANASSTNDATQPSSGGSVDTSGSTVSGSDSGSDSGDSTGGGDSDEDTEGAAGKGGSKGGGEKDAVGASKGDVDSSLGSATPTAASESDGGGISVFLIIIAVLAAGAVGLAVWRIRAGRGDGDVGGQAAGVNPGA